MLIPEYVFSAGAAVDSSEKFVAVAGSAKVDFYNNDTYELYYSHTWGSGYNVLLGTFLDVIYDPKTNYFFAFKRIDWGVRVIRFNGNNPASSPVQVDTVDTMDDSPGANARGGMYWTQTDGYIVGFSTYNLFQSQYSVFGVRINKISLKPDTIATGFPRANLGYGGTGSSKYLLANFVSDGSAIFCLGINGYDYDIDNYRSRLIVKRDMNNLNIAAYFDDSFREARSIAYHNYHLYYVNNSERVVKVNAANGEIVAISNPISGIGRGIMTSAEGQLWNFNGLNYVIVDENLQIFDSGEIYSTVDYNNQEYRMGTMFSGAGVNGFSWPDNVVGGVSQTYGIGWPKRIFSNQFTLRYRAYYEGNEPGFYNSLFTIKIVKGGGWSVGRIGV
jgi:hypothetical protein